MALGIDLSAQLFDLSAGSEGDLGWAEGEVAGQIMVGGVDLAAEFCRGIDLTAAIGASAKLEGAGGIFNFLAGSASLAGHAHAGVSARAQLPTDLFDEFGLVVQIKALAELAVSARVDVGLTFGAVRGLANGLDALSYELLMLLLDEAEIGGGAYAKAAVTAQAQLTASMLGRLREGDSRFSAVFRVGAGVEAGGGAGAHLYAELSDPFRYYRRTTERCLFEVTSHVRPHLVGQDRAWIEIAELVFPIALDSAFICGQAIYGVATDASASAEAFLTSAAERLQQWTVEKAAEAALDTLLDMIVEWATGQDDSTRRATAAALRAVTAAALTDDLNAPGLLGLVPAVMDVALSAGLPDSREVTVLGTIAWSGFVVARSLQGLLPTSGYTVGIRWPGAEVPLAGANLVHVPSPPSAVRTELEETLGRRIPAPSLADVVEYLVQNSTRLLDPQVSGGVNRFLNSISSLVGVSPSEALADIVGYSQGGSIVGTNAFSAFQTWLNTLLDAAADAIMRGLQGAPEYVQRWVEATLNPSLDLINRGVISRLAAVLEGSAADSHKLAQEISQVAGVVVAQLAFRQFIVLAEFCMEAFQKNLHQSCYSIADQVRRHNSHPLVLAAEVALTPSLNLTAESSGADRARVQRLLSELLEAAGDAFGPDMYPAELATDRRKSISSLLDGVPQHLDASDEDAISRTVQEFMDCWLPADLAGGLGQLALIDLEALGRATFRMLQRSLPALSEYYLDSHEELVRLLDQTLLETARSFADAVVAAHAAWDSVSAVAQDVSDAVEDARGELADWLDAVKSTLLTDGNALRAATRSSLQRTLIGLDDADPIPPQLPFHAQASLAAFDVIPYGAWDIAAGLLRGLSAKVEEIVLGAATVSAVMARLRRDVDALVDTAFLGLLGTIDSAQFETALRRALRLESLRPVVSEAVTVKVRVESGEVLGKRMLEAATTSDATVQVLAPQSLGPRDAGFAYAGHLDLILKLRPAHLSAVRDPELCPIVVLLNGRRLNIRPALWAKDGQSVVLHHSLAPVDGLRHGMNTLEVATLSGGGARREQLLFNVNISGAGSVGAFEIVPDKTVVDTPGDDHRRPGRERITLRWLGDQPLDLGGWQLADRGHRHAFKFPTVRVDPSGEFTVRTGGTGARRGLSFSMGRSRAVWNNRGDTVRLIDPTGTIQFERIVNGGSK